MMNQEAINELHTDQQMVPRGTEFMYHLGIDAHWPQIRDWIIDRYPEHPTSWVVFWGKTGVGKRLARYGLICQAKQDEILKTAIVEKHTSLGFPKKQASLRIVTGDFSSAANLGILRGLINPNHGHGQYTKREYREASKILSEYTLQPENNFEGPTLVVIEPTGPAAIIHNGRLEGTDRGVSTVYLLGQNHVKDTRIFVIKKSLALARRILKVRRALADAKPEDVPAVLEDMHLDIVRRGRSVNLRRLSPADLAKIQEMTVRGMAPAKGVQRSNRETARLMRSIYGTNCEDVFWPPYLNDLGYYNDNFYIVNNEVVTSGFPLDIDLLEKYDPMQSEIRARRALLGLSADPATASFGTGRFIVGSAIGQLDSITAEGEETLFM